MPHIGIKYTHLKTSSFTSKIDGKDFISNKKQSLNIAQMPVGVTFASKPLNTIGGYNVTPIVDVSYVRAFGDVKSNYMFNFSGFSSIHGIRGKFMDRDAISGLMGINVQKFGLNFGLNYGTRISAHEQEHKVTATVGWEF